MEEHITNKEGAEKLKTNQNLKLDEHLRTRMEAFDNLSSFFTFENKSISLS